MNIKEISVMLTIVICIIIIFIIGLNIKQKDEIEKPIYDETTVATEEAYKESESPTEETTQTEETKVIEEYTSVWTTSIVDIRKEPNMYSEIINSYSWNTMISVTYINDDWAKIKNTEYYVDRTFLSEDTVGYNDCDVPDNTIKSYMDYRRITARNSKQYELQKSLAYTGDNGLRMVNERYCVALGSYYTTTIGQYVDIELENGVVIYGILADCKADKDTDSTNRLHPDGSVVEFVVDSNCLYYTVKIMGDVSYVNGWDSKIAKIIVYDKIEDF